MIKFFRHIRKSLLIENKISKYFKYAIGEIILVVIGILIALSLNNWKEDLENQGEEKRILTGLKQEFEINLSEIERNIKLNTGTKESTVSLILQIRSKNPFGNTKKVDSLLNEVYMFGSFDAQTGLVNEVISSGKLSIISDIDLRDRLKAVTGILDNLEEDYVIRSDYYYNQIIPYISKYFSLINSNNYMKFSSWSKTYKTFKLPESPFRYKYNEIDLLLFENLIATHKLNNDFVNLDESSLKDFFKETLEIINTNLESIK